MMRDVDGGAECEAVRSIPWLHFAQCRGWYLEMNSTPPGGVYTCVAR